MSWGGQKREAQPLGIFTGFRALVDPARHAWAPCQILYLGWNRNQEVYCKDCAHVYLHELSANVDRYKTLLSKCSWTVNLVLNGELDLDFLCAAQQMRLQKLAFTVLSVLSTWNLTDPLFATTISTFSMETVSKVVAECPWLAVTVAATYVMGRDAAIDFAANLTITDLRVVVMSIATHYEVD
ncbi:hypothetical protein K438DRAFT_1974311 [Mycena galopus ATCC 62051]|nr:hypothetical protein K438DRAFT_1974311 [Mycena galopus ATCC 62051]